MVKKISYTVLSVAILISGYFALTTLNYWERSIRIFKLSNSAQSFEGRGERGRGGLRGGEGIRDRGRFNVQEGFRDGYYRSEGPRVPDSIRANFRTRNRPQGTRNRNVTDSLRQGSMRYDREINGRDQFEAGMRGGEGRGRGDWVGGKKIYMRNVIWFLAVFASFTVIVIYFEKAFNLIRKRKSR